MIDHFNPVSNFYLSLRLNYPNLSDSILGVKGKFGSDIFIHGNCVTIGCIPITDSYIKELYWLAVQARANGQTKIPVHIFPMKMITRNMDKLKREFGEKEALISFWKNLKEGYDFFEINRTLPIIRINRQGV